VDKPVGVVDNPRMSGYRDPLRLTREQRRTGMAGVARAKQILDEAKSKRPCDYEKLLRAEVDDDYNDGRYSQR
jgi:hypothetical protein